MVYSYFPGCTLKNKAKDLDECARNSAEALGFTLSEVPEWQCCGGVYSMSRQEIAVRLPSVRALVSAREAGQDLVTLCSACHNVIKRVNDDMANDAEIRERVQNYMQLDTPYTGETHVYHYLEILRDKVGFDNLKKAVKKPLSGMKIGAYYGCLLLRPNDVMQFDDPENPSILEDFISALGATPVSYAMRNECCGGYLTVSEPEISDRKSLKVLASATDMGAEMLITACPLCQYNLAKSSSSLPIVYFTELLSHALGIRDMKGGVR